jgi:hypothetical protein
MEALWPEGQSDRLGGAALNIRSSYSAPRRVVVCGSQRLSNKSPSHVRFAGVLRFALWLAAYVILGLLLAMFVQSLGNWLLS